MTRRDARPLEEVKTEVLVVGAGPAGLAAAVCAARRGLRVLLAERYGFAGGQAVAGLSGTICGLYTAVEEPRKPERLVFGLVDELMDAIESLGGLGRPIRYGKTLVRVHDSVAYRRAADGLLEGSGVEVLYHALAQEAIMDGERTAGVRFSTLGGAVDIHADLVIDATGDANILAMAGRKTYCGADGKVQNPTMIFKLQGVDVKAFRAAYGEDSMMPPSVATAIEQARGQGEELPRSAIWLFPTPNPGELLCNCTRIGGDDGRGLNCSIPKDLSEAEIGGRRQVQAYARFFRRNLAGCGQAWVSETGVQVGVRQTRQGEGLERLRNADVVQGRKRKDGIADSAWPIELHSGDKPSVHWLIDDYYQVPFGCLVPSSGEGLLFGGRCLSAEHEAMASARVTAQCYTYGEALGAAAFQHLREAVPLRSISGASVRSAMGRAR